VLALGWYFDGFRLEDRPDDVAGADLADASGDAAETAPEVEIIDDEPSVPDAGAVDEPAPAASGIAVPQLPATLEAPPAPALSSVEANNGDAPQAQPEAAQTTTTQPPASQPAPPPEAALVEQVPAPDEPDEPVEPQQASAAREPTPAPRTESQSDAAPSATQVAGSGSSRLVFSMSADAWLQVKDAQDRTLYVGTSRGGTTRVVQGDPPFWVTVGNADAVSLEFDGEPVELAPHMHTAGVARLVLE